MPDRDATYGTIDLAEATVLASQGFDYALSKLSRSQATWTFTPPTDNEEEFWTVVQDYREGLSRVEPRSFMLEVKKMRSELYQFLGPHAPQRPATAEAV